MRRYVGCAHFDQQALAEGRQGESMMGGRGVDLSFSRGALSQVAPSAEEGGETQDGGQDKTGVRIPTTAAARDADFVRGGDSVGDGGAADERREAVAVWR